VERFAIVTKHDTPQNLLQAAQGDTVEFGILVWILPRIS
jgi:hypothetical protein